MCYMTVFYRFVNETKEATFEIYCMKAYLRDHEFFVSKKMKGEHGLEL